MDLPNQRIKPGSPALQGDLLGEGCDIEVFIILMGPGEEGTAYPEDHTNSPKVQSLVMGGKKSSEQGFKQMSGWDS